MFIIAPSVVHVEDTQYTFVNTREEEKVWSNLLNPVHKLQNRYETTTNPSNQLNIFFFLGCANSREARRMTKCQALEKFANVAGRKVDPW